MSECKVPISSLSHFWLAFWSTDKIRFSPTQLAFPKCKTPAYMNRCVKPSSQWPVEIGKMNSCFFSLLKSTPLSIAFFTGTVGRQVRLKWDLLWQNNCWEICGNLLRKGFGFTPPTYIRALLGMVTTSVHIQVWKLQASMYIQLDMYRQTYAKITALKFRSCVRYFRDLTQVCADQFLHPLPPVVISLSVRSLPQYLRKGTKIWDFEEISVPILYFKSTTFWQDGAQKKIQSMPNRISMKSSFIPPRVWLLFLFRLHKWTLNFKAYKRVDSPDVEGT